jgi:hypothetical protein
MLVLAHAGHWFVGMIYFAPVGGFMIWLGIVTRRDRKAEARGERDDEA